MTVDAVEEMYSSGKSTRAIAEVVGHSHTWVRRRLEQLGVPRRTHQEAAAKQVRYNTCVVCGAVFRPPANLERKTCSGSCLRVYNQRTGCGKNSPNWTGGRSQARYQRIRRISKLQICESCGRSDGRLDTHHRDRDRSNNTPDNIMVLCASCHAKLHYVEDDRGLRGWNAAKAQELKDRTHYEVGQ